MHMIHTYVQYTTIYLQQIIRMYLWEAMTKALTGSLQQTGSMRSSWRAQVFNTLLKGIAT